MPSFVERLKARKFSAASSTAVDIGVSGETNARLIVDAGGKLTWGSGSATGDTNLYRDSANSLTTDDDLKVAGKLSLTASSGDEGGEIFLAQAVTNTTLSGGITIDSYQNKIRFFEQGGTARGAYIDLTACTGGAGTNLLSGGGGATTLDGLNDVTAPSPSSGDFLKWNGSAWVNDAIDLGTDTTGNYVTDVSAGTGVTITHTPSEGSTATIAIGQAVATSDSPTFAGLTINGASVVFEGATANDFETTVTVTDPTADRTITLPNATGTVALTADKLSAFASTSSSELAGVISDETGSGALVFGTSPAITTSLTTPSTTFSLLNTTATTINFGGDATTLNIGNANGTTAIAGYLTSKSINVSVAQVNILNNDTYSPNDGLFFFTTDVNSIYTQLKASTATSSKVITLPNTTGTLATLAGSEALTNKTINGLTVSSSTGTLTIANGKTLTASNTLTFTGTDSSSVAFGTGGTVAYTNVTTLSSLISVGTITTGTWSATEIAATKGGTGQTTYTTGDILYSNATNSLAKLAAVATGNALISGGTGTAPSWGKIGISTHVSGLDTGMATFLGAATAANLRGTLAAASQTGTGAVVFAASPTLTGTATIANISSGGDIAANTFTVDSGSFFRTVAFPTTSNTATVRVGSALGYEFCAKVSSFRELKDNIVDIPNALQMISTLRPRRFTWKPQPDENPEFAQLRELDPAFGFIVEEVAETNRELLCWSQPEEQYGIGPQSLEDLDKWYYSYWRESDMIALSVKAIQELSAKVEALEARLV